MEKLASRKLWTLILTQVALLLGVQFDIGIGVLIATAAVSCAYILAQSYVDAVGAGNTKVDEILTGLEKLADIMAPKAASTNTVEQLRNRRVVE